MQITTIGLEVLKFFASLPPCLIGMEACATAHYWARELTKLDHEVRLMPAKDVKAYVKRNKSDAADAEAICEARSPPHHAICGGEVGRTAGPADTASHTRPADAATNAGDQCVAGAFGWWQRKDARGSSSC
jgi:hypothetical protein